MRWLPLVERWHPDFPDLDPAWVLGVIAQESQGFHYAEGEDGWGSVGLMQIIPRSWTGSKDWLLEPANNIYTGMRMLDAILGKTDGDIRLALAAYNCGFEGVEAEECGTFGGMAYADRIITYWVPVFRSQLFREAVYNEWLSRLGYKDGLGKWDNRERRDERFGKWKPI